MLKFYMKGKYLDMYFYKSLQKKIIFKYYPSLENHSYIFNFQESVQTSFSGLGKLQEGRENTGNQQPTAPSDYQFNYLPEGLREDEKSGEGGGKSAGAKSSKSSTNNFFNMDAASEANKMFSSYNNVKVII